MIMKIKPSFFLFLLLAITIFSTWGLVKAHNLTTSPSKSGFEKGMPQTYTENTSDLPGLYTLSWSVISSGGMDSTGGSYTMHSTLGQPVAGSGTSGDYSFTSGFWTKVVELVNHYFEFLPLIVR